MEKKKKRNINGRNLIIKEKNKNNKNIMTEFEIKKNMHYDADAGKK